MHNVLLYNRYTNLFHFHEEWIKIQFARLECKKCHNILHKSGNFKMQRRNLAKKNDDLYNVDRKFCKLFCGFADSLDEAQKQVPAEKKAPEDLLPSVK